MKKGKAVGPDGIPAEVWKCLGGEGIVVDILWDLMSKDVLTRTNARHVEK